MQKLRYRSIWLSDLHLGTRDAKAEFLLDFLKHTDSDFLYLVGDILDLWKLNKGWYWPPIKNDLVRAVMEKARRGTRVIYIPGNHDELLRNYVGSLVGGVHIEQDAIHRTVDGRRFLVMHGDEFDFVVMHNKWLAHIGDKGYEILLRINHWYNVARRRLGLKYWSLSAYVKQRVKKAVNYIGNFEQAVALEAQRRGVDGLICGHIHHASMRNIDGYLYGNTGDWVENCTALVEDSGGTLQILHWSEESALLFNENELDCEPYPASRPIPQPPVTTGEPEPAS